MATDAGRRSNARLLWAATICTLFAVPWGDDRDVGLPRRSWEAHSACLDGLAHALTKYREKHGAWPGNDEGLYALDTFDARFKALVPVQPPVPGEVAFPDPARFLEHHVFPRFLRWRMFSDEIAAFRTKHGRAPQNAAEFGAPLFQPEGLDDPDFRKIECAITDNNQLLLLGGHSVLDPSLTPYVYENRDNLGKEPFAGSIADADRGRKFSRQLAPGIVVYSYNARDCYESYRDAWIGRYGRVYAFGALALGLWVAAIVRAVRHRLFKGPLLIPPLAWVLTAAAGTVVMATCYIASSLPHRSPKALAAQKELLKKFRDSGVIREETYQKALQAFEADTILQKQEP